jgi:uncharacterized protein YcbX
VAPAGVVLALNRYPVKSMAGEPASSLQLWPGGVAGDRAHALYWRGGRRLTARVAPRMLAWKASCNGDLNAHVTAPDGREFSWSDEGLRAAISEDLGKDVELVRDPGHLMQDLERSVLVTVESTHAALESELAREIDVRRFRPNVHVRLADTEPFAELGWEGRRLRIGDAELELLHTCVRCVMVTRDPDTQEAWPQLLRHLHRQHSSVYGINARPLGEATIAVGDPVEVL